MLPYINWGLVPEGTTHVVIGSNTGDNYMLSDGRATTNAYYEKHEHGNAFEWNGKAWRLFQTLEEMEKNPYLIRVSRDQWLKEKTSPQQLKDAIAIVQANGFILSKAPDKV